MDVQVRKYKGEKQLQRGIQQMMELGYHVQDQGSRKQMYSPLTGVFTSKQIHTVTFVKDEPQPSRPDMDFFRDPG